MSETLTHRKLLEYLIEFYRKNFNERIFFTFCDDGNQKPFIIRNAYGKGVIPDFYSVSTIESIMIIGEAKTTYDIINPHSINQYIEYINELETFNGKRYMIFSIETESLVVINNFIHNKLAKLQRRTITYIILDGRRRKVWKNYTIEIR